MIKIPNKASIEGTYLNVMNIIYDKPTTNITVNAENFSFKIKGGKKQGCPLLPLLLNIILEVLAIAIRYEKEIKGIQIGKEEVKLSPFAGYVILHREPQRFHQKMNYQKQKLRKQSCLQLHKK